MQNAGATRTYTRCTENTETQKQIKRQVATWVHRNARLIHKYTKKTKNTKNNAKHKIN